MKTLGWPTLKDRRSRLKLAMLYKLNSGMVHIPRDDLVANPQKPFSYIVPSSSVDSHLHSFFPSTIRLWNSIPISCKSKPSLDTFKSSLEQITLENPYYSK